MPDPGDGDRLRCGWAGSAPEYLAYHDDEWGRPLRGVPAMFERLCLEGFQSGLSWIVILRKRPAFRAAFAGFDPEAVARFGDADVGRLLADAGIVRNRAKIEATVHNARRVLELDTPLDELLWSFAPDPADHPRPATLADVPATSGESTAMAKELKRRGLRFVGPTTCYALMQAAGLVDDHVRDCWRAATSRMRSVSDDAR
jgi:DNA-3-methyladenine glycosylase I